MRRWDEVSGLGAVVLLGLALQTGPGAAQQAACDNPITQLEMNLCAEADFKAADAGLNTAYQVARDAMRQLDADLPASQRGAEVALRDAQRVWISFRDQACLAEAYSWTGGSGYPMVYVGCQARLTEQRAADLWALAGG